MMSVCHPLIKNPKRIFVFGRDISALFLAPRNLQSCLCVRLAVIGQVPNSDQRKGGGAGLSRS